VKAARTQAHVAGIPSKSLPFPLKTAQHGERTRFV
jgi:hypothetical protein